MSDDWKRLADGLPAKSGMYIVNVSGMSLLDGVHALYFNAENGLWIDQKFYDNLGIERSDKRKKSIFHDHVVDWMPMPKPPKKESA